MASIDFGPNGERRIQRARSEKLAPEEKAERARLSRQRWKEANPDYARQWREANADKHRAYSRATARRRKAKDRRNAVARKKYRENPEPERERGRRFRREHPEKVAEYARRYREKNPEKHAEQSRRATEKWRDRNADKQREKQRIGAAEKRAADPDKFRAWYQANLERERARSREAAQLRSRLKALGLPPRKITRVYANDRRANVAAADLFFSERRSPDVVHALQREPKAGASAAVARQNAREKFEPTPPHLLAEWARDSALARARLSRDEYRAMYAKYLERHAPRLRDEASMDSRARQARGGAPLDVEKEVRARAAQELSAAENARLAQVVKRATASFGVPASAAVTTGRAPTTDAAPLKQTSSRDKNRGR